MKEQKVLWDHLLTCVPSCNLITKEFLIIKQICGRLELYYTNCYLIKNIHGMSQIRLILRKL